MLKIYLVRHGQDQDNAAGILNGHRDEPLTDIGVAQAREIAAKLQALGLRLDQVYAAPLQRTYRTAEIITDSLGLAKPLVLADLVERDFGSMTGQPQARIMELCAPDILPTDTIIYFLKPQGGETFPQVLKRAKRLLALLNSRHHGGAVLLVTHGDVGKMIYAAYYGLDWKQVLKLFHFGNSDLLELSADSPAEQTHVHAITQYNI